MPKTEAGFKHNVSQATGVSSHSTTSTTFIDLNDMSVTTTTGANNVLIIFSGTFSNTSAVEDIRVILDIDGGTKASTERLINVAGANYHESISFSWVELMTEGTHTFKIQWRVSGGTGTFTNDFRTMQVIEFK